MLDCLKMYISMGWAVFPCSNKTKAPITPHGFKDASLDFSQIQEWYRLYPDCAWGSPTSAQRGVVDIDPRNGGVESLAKLEAEHGKIPPTPTVLTGGIGHHHWMAFPPGTKCGVIADGIDRKAEGGYVIIPPSKIHIPEHEGRKYAWKLRPWEMAIIKAPGWASDDRKPFPAVGKASPVASADPWTVQAPSDDLLTHPGSPEGERRKNLCKMVGVHLARGDSASSIMAMAQALGE